MPDYAVYLEFHEEELQYATSSITDTDEFDIEEQLDEPQGIEEVDESIFFMPAYLYRSPLVGCMKFDIDFDPAGYDRLHLVVIRYTQADDEGLTSGKWFVEGVYKTRREAKEVEFAIEEGEYTSEKDLPWKGDNVEFDAVNVVTLGLED